LSESTSCCAEGVERGVLRIVQLVGAGLPGRLGEVLASFSTASKLR
jgi:hypothetical protein